GGVGKGGGARGSPGWRRAGGAEGDAARVLPGRQRLGGDCGVRPLPPRHRRRPGRARGGGGGGLQPRGGSGRARARGRERQYRDDPGAAMTTSFDAITLEVLWTRIISVVDEAAKAIVRTWFSTLSNEANDFACVLPDARGFALAQNSGSIPSFIGTLPATVRHFLAGIGSENMRSGDVLITNDPWQGTGHMSDVCLVKPIFLQKDGQPPRLVAFSSTTAHMP